MKIVLDSSVNEIAKISFARLTDEEKETDRFKGENYKSLVDIEDINKKSYHLELTLNELIEFGILSRPNNKEVYQVLLKYMAEDMIVHNYGLIKTFNNTYKIEEPMNSIVHYNPRNFNGIVKTLKPSENKTYTDIDDILCIISNKFCDENSFDME